MAWPDDTMGPMNNGTYTPYEMSGNQLPTNTQNVNGPNIIRQLYSTPVASTQGAQGVRASNYMDQFNDMLAPYQAMAQRFSSPYAMFPPNSQFAANHPMAAGAIDRGLLSAALTPSSNEAEGVGSGISRALQGVMGSNDFARTRAMQAAMMPYQMLQPRLQAMDTMSQMAERQAMVPYYASRSKYYDAMMGVQQQRADTAADRADIAQQQQNTRESHQDWLESKDPAGTALGSGGGWVGKLTAIANPIKPGETQQDYATRLLGAYNTNAAAAAGQHTTAVQGAGQPFKQDDERERQFLATQKNSALAGIPKTLTQQQWMKGQDIMSQTDYLSNPDKAKKDYATYSDDVKMRTKAANDSYGQYLNDKKASASGMTYDQWIAGGRSQTQSAPASTPSAPKNSGSSWTPQ